MIAKEQYAQAVALIGKGLPDRRIAEQVGIANSTVGRIRQNMGIPARSYRHHVPWEVQEQRMGAYHRGLTDREAAAECGCSVGAYKIWRQREHLTANIKIRER